MTWYLLSQSAQRDLQGIREYLAPAPLAIRLRIIADLEASFLRALRFPHMGRGEPEYTARYKESVRSFAVRPYRVFYLPDRLPLTILAVLHGAQNIPSILRNRSRP